MTLNDREIIVLSTKIMRLQEKDALQYCKVMGHEMSVPTYYRTLGTISANTMLNLQTIARNFQDLHLERIQELELVRRELWKCYHAEEKPMLKARILREIKELQPYYSAYLESTQYILEEKVRQFTDEKNNSLPPLKC